MLVIPKREGCGVQRYLRATGSAILAARCHMSVMRPVSCYCCDTDRIMVRGKSHLFGEESPENSRVRSGRALRSRPARR